MDVFTKNRVSNWIIILLVIMNLGTLGTILFLHFKQPSLPRNGGPDPAQHFLERELHLTEEQAQQFEELRKEHFLQSKAINDEVHQLKSAIMEELFSSSPDSEKVERLAEEIGKKQAELEQLRFQHFLALKSLCQPEQVEKLQALIHEIVRPPAPPGSGRPPEREQPSRPGESPGPRRQEPPGEAIDACQGRIRGDSCQFESPRGTVKGTCRTIQNQLACVPETERP